MICIHFGKIIIKTKKNNTEKHEKPVAHKE